MLEGIKKPYVAPAFEFVQFKLENVLTNQLTSFEKPIVDVGEDMDEYDSGTDG